MNSYLQYIQDLLQQNQQLAPHEKDALLKSIADINKQWNIIELQLGNADKVNQATSIRLEETIEELEQKRKAVEAQKHELVIETALERVRAIAMGMMQPADMLEVCKTISHQLTLLNVKEIRNVQTAIFHEDKGTYMNYEYYAKHDKTFITETTYTNNKIHNAFAEQMLKGNGEFFVTHIKGDEVKNWIAYQKTTNVFIDDYLNTASSLNYYWYSLGPVALGISTYEPLKEEDTVLFKRFLKVFELAYRRYLDIEKAEAQAREAQIQLGLERVRARTMAMQKSDELSETAYILFQQFRQLGDIPLQITIGIFNEEKEVIEFRITGFDGSGSKVDQAYEMNIHEPVLLDKLYAAWKEQEKSVVIKLTGKEMRGWVAYRNKISGRAEAASTISDDELRFVGVGFFSKGLISFSKPEPIESETINILERFAGVFEQTYTRFLDLQKAEAQARESQIQLALERVRARTMAMQKSEELANVATVMFQQVKALGVPQWACGFCIWDIGDTECMWYSGSADGEILTPQRFPLTGHPVFRIMDESRKRGDELYILEKEGELQADHYRYMMTLPGVGERLQDMLDAGLTIPAFQVDHYANFAYGNLIFITYEHFPEMHNVFKRFAKVFEQTYTRFLDLQKAEAQARESQVQLALERVRARTMAMQRSDELPEAANLLFQQVQSLGAPSWTAGYCIFDEDKKAITLSMSRPWGDIQPSFRAPLDENPSFIRYLEAHNKGLELYIEEISGEALEQNYTYLLTLPVVGEQLTSIIAEGHTFPTYEVDHCAYFSKGFLLFITYQPVPELHDVFKRFASVFDQTYTRFLDLQKAEAQAREARIEAALERVRSSTMAMHKSEDLPKTAAVLFGQLRELGDTPDRISIGIIHEAAGIADMWLTDQSGNEIDYRFVLDLDEKTTVQKLVKEWKAGVKSMTVDLTGDELRSWLNYVRKIGLVVNEEHFKNRRVHNVAFFSHGWLNISTLEPMSRAMMNILERFATVYSLTYRRFLDLQKAEAQAREAQIETALEKVRSRSLAMHKSDELQEVVQTVFEKLKELNVDLYTAIIFIFTAGSNDVIWWLANNANQQYSRILVPYADNPYLKDITDAKENGMEFFSKNYSYEEKNELFHHLFEKTDFKYVPEQQKKFLLESEFATMSVALTKNTGINITSYSRRSFSESDNEILKRFAIVFEQAYTRFLDLQKAEAQAREAQIEAALEKVRSRTMAMHKSEELIEVVASVFQQLQQLNFRIDTASISPDYKENPFEYWLAIPGQPYPTEITVPYADITFMNYFIQEAKTSKGLIRVTFGKAEKDEWIQHTIQHTIVKDASDERKKLLLDAPGIAISVAKSKKIAITITNFAVIPYTDEENEILRRFAIVFDQTYTRFLDLQKAETQAREAEIELALERVRARTMAMQKSDELIETSLVLFEQFGQLGEAAEQISIGIINEKEMVGEMSATVHGNKLPGMHKISLREPIVMRNVYEAWKSQKKSLMLEIAGESLEAYNKYRNGLIGQQVYPEKADPADRWIINAVFFSKGFLSFSSGEQRPKETIDLLERFSGVFDLTYTRFLDLQKAETQAREAEIELALERVRARTMAMKKHDDLTGVIDLLAEQLLHLGFNLQVANFSNGISDKDWDLWIYAVFGDLKISTRAIFPWFDHPYFNRVKHAIDLYKTDGTDLSEAVFNKQEKDSWLDYVFTQTTFRELPVELRKYHYETPGYCWSSILLKETWVAIGKYDTKPFSDEENKILRKFANAFGQAYTRFLDLQKAEAQAREAQIEAALERVRSRSMAMHQSSDLHEVIMVVTEQLLGLGIKFNVANFAKIFSEGSWDLWISTPDQAYPALVHVPYMDHGLFNNVIEAIEQGRDFVNDVYDQEEKNIFFKHFFENTLAKNTPAERKEYVMNCKGFARSLFLTKNIWLAVSNYDGIPFSNEENAIFKRFANAFEQTYTRFLDLQRAEAQAREAQIEAALEKVRSHSLAMHKSDELQDVVHTVFEKLKELEVDFYTAIIILFAKDSKDIVWWLESDGGKLYPRVRIPYANITYLKNVFEARENGKEIFSKCFSFEEKNELFHHLFGATDFKYVSEQQKKFLLETEFATMAVALAKNTGIHITSYSRTSFSEKDNEILKRFAKVFEQSYTRFLDLQKAEVQAKEAQIEAALERVRSRAMAMHNSQDLADTIGVFYKELHSFSLIPIRCGVGLLDKEERVGELYTWNTTEQGESLQLVGRLKMEGHPILNGVYEHWLQQKEYHPMLRGNEIKEYYKILRPQIAFPDYNHDQVQYGYFFFFKEGGVYAWTEKEMLEDELQIYRRFTSVLSLTYKRYSDLKIAEASAKEAIKQSALDRIRADIASMRTVSDLERITPLIWNELTILGLPFIRCGVFLMDDAQQLIHTFLSTPDGKAIAAFHMPYDTPGNLGKVLSHWREKKNYTDHWSEAEFTGLADVLVQQGAIANREEYLASLPHGGFYLHFLPFLQGMLYVGNTTQLDDEAIKLLQSVSDAFSTAYARYEDFNKLEAAKKRVDSTLNELQATQKQLIQSEKMASLGELTAGIAHEIQNPLNFVNNFSEVNNELIEELESERRRAEGERDKVLEDEIINDIKQNLEKINHHGKRADAIVKGMLQHSRTGSGQKEPTDINALSDEYLRLAYHGLRAKDKSFNAEIKTDFDAGIGKINVIPQDIGRVLLNLFNNAFYAVSERYKVEGERQKALNSIPSALHLNYKPTVSVQTKKINDTVEIIVADNGMGIPQNIVDKIFQPFFTTKPTGQGTGLGLSLAYDIVKAHGGEIKLKTKEGEGSEFIIRLPIHL